MTNNKEKKVIKKNSYYGPAIGVAALVFLMLFQGGFFASGQINPGMQPNTATYSGETIKIEATKQPDFYQAIGSVRSRNEVEIIPRIIARILEVKVRSGDQVKKGDILATLDAQDLSAVVSQSQEQINAASAGVSGAKEQENSAKAAKELAHIELKRAQALYSKKAISKRDLDLATTSFKQAEAGLQSAIQGKNAAIAKLAAARQARKQSQAGLSYASILSPIDGIVAERLVDPGDLGNPSSIMMKVFDPKSLLLEVAIRESLVAEVTIGAEVTYKVPALNKSFSGTVKEIVPAVDPQTRTFLAKICIEGSEGLMPGMFGTVSVPLKTQKEVILIPESSIIKTGQLESIIEISSGKELRRQIRTIKATEGLREVVSGLKAGQIIKKL